MSGLWPFRTPLELCHYTLLRAVTTSKLWVLEHRGNSCRCPIPGIRLQILEVNTSTKTEESFGNKSVNSFAQHNADSYQED